MTERYITSDIDLKGTDSSVNNLFINITDTIKEIKKNFNTQIVIKEYNIKDDITKFVNTYFLYYCKETKYYSFVSNKGYILAKDISLYNLLYNLVNYFEHPETFENNVYNFSVDSLFMTFLVKFNNN